MAQNTRAADIIADWWTGVLERGDKEKFRAALHARVSAMLAAASNNRVMVSTDYDPDDTLQEVLDSLGIKSDGVVCCYCDGVLPRKSLTQVWGDGGVVEIKHGRGNWLAPVPLGGEE